MFQRQWSFLGVIALAAAALLWSADPASAQRRGGGGGYRDGGWGWGDGWGYGYGGWGWRPYGYYGSYGWYRPGYDGSYTYYPSNYAEWPTFYGNRLSSIQTGEELSEPSFYQNQPVAGLTIRIPDPNGQIWLNDQETKQKGTFRPFVTPPLEAGRTYSYKVHARWRQNGKDMDQTKTVDFKAGDRVAVNFDGQTTEGSDTLTPAPAPKGTPSFPSSDSPKGTAPSPSDKAPPAVPNRPPAGKNQTPPSTPPPQS
jgi:uncharacterized protein (TIGR03000 family)